MAVTLNIFIVSDATGSTAEAVVTSSLVQFSGAHSNIRRFPFVRNEDQVDEVIKEAPAHECIIVFTFVSPELSEYMIQQGREKNLTVFDVMSPMMGILADILEYAPAQTPGVFHSQMEEAYLVTEAIHYTLRHDDGNGLATVNQADLIILGVSRTGKTPTSIFLSCRKLKVANIPIIREVSLPSSVIESPVPKVGFRMELDRQYRLRSERMGRHHSRIPGYADRSAILAELEYADNLYRRIPGIQTVDVTNRSVEETSDWITHNVL